MPKWAPEGREPYFRAFVEKKFNVVLYLDIHRSILNIFLWW